MLAALAGVAALGVRLAQALSGPPEGWPVTLGLYWQIVGFLVLLLLAGALAYRTLAAFTLSYELDRNGLVPPTVSFYICLLPSRLNAAC